ncbi:hypothetical protein ACRXCV_10085 [Halobacteriovorax sp. GFR7]|uniref:hypothetical protein n=1 Tax=unclassified Halobacteriovorax TaxID=2639665 RepID=UPI003D967A38
MLDLNPNDSTIKLIPVIYCIFTFMVGLYFLYLSLSSFRVRQVFKSNYAIERMPFYQAIICFLVVSVFFVPFYSDYKVGVALLIFLFLFLARLELWKILGDYLQEHHLLMILYKIVVYLALFIFGVHYLIYLMEGSGACCISDNVIAKSNNQLAKTLLPFNLSNLLTSSYRVVAFLSLAIYMRFTYLSFKKADKYLFAGLAVHIIYYLHFLINFLVTHDYWVPIFFLADLVIYLRLIKLVKKK